MLAGDAPGLRGMSALEWAAGPKSPTIGTGFLNRLRFERLRFERFSLNRLRLDRFRFDGLGLNRLCLQRLDLGDSQIKRWRDRRA